MQTRERETRVRSNLELLSLSASEESSQDMGFKFLLRKFKAIKLRQNGRKAIMNSGERKRIKASMGISHGFHMVERAANSEGYVLAQREQVEDMEVWLFGAFDQKMGSKFTKYLKTHLFDNELSEYQIERKAKGTMKKAYFSTRTKLEERGKGNEIEGFTTMLVMNGEKFVAASFGGYKAIMCRDGMASQIGTKHKRKDKGRRYIADMFHTKCAANNGDHKPNNSSKLIVTAQKVGRNTDFIILGSDGVWEVMRNQEAVDLISHIEDAQKAAECLAEEALIRMSKSTISCIVIRFH